MAKLPTFKGLWPWPWMWSYCILRDVACCMLTCDKQGVALTGRITLLALHGAIIRLEATYLQTRRWRHLTWRHRLVCAGDATSSLILARCGVLQMTTDATDVDNRRQQAKQYWTPYTMCRRANNKPLVTSVQSYAGTSSAPQANRHLHYLYSSWQDFNWYRVSHGSLGDSWASW